MNERTFYSESTTTRKLELNCPHCRTVSQFELRWMLCRKKDHLPGNADEDDRRRFAKAQSYMVLLDDLVVCPNLRCRKRFDTSSVKSMAFLSAEQEAALPPLPRQAPRDARSQQREHSQGNRRSNGNQLEPPRRGPNPRGRNDRQPRGPGGRDSGRTPRRGGY